MNELYELFGEQIRGKEEFVLDLLEKELDYLSAEGFLKECEDGSIEFKTEEEIKNEILKV